MQREKLSRPQVAGGADAPKPRWLRPCAGAAVCLAALVSSAAVQAQGITVNAGDTSTLTITADLDCHDLIVNGTLNAPGATFTRVGNVIIGAAGQLNADNAVFAVSKSWQNSGTFSGAASTVTASNDCANTSTTFSGNTAFGNLKATIAGHSLSFAAGSEQTVSGLLTLSGVTLTGQGGTAYLTLSTGGTQSIANVGVSAVDASRGQHLAPTSVNVITGTATNWFGSPTPSTPEPAVPVPANSPAGLALLAGLMLGAAQLARRWSGKSRSKSGQGK
ncbi:hypothetical protein G7048_16605 [Diaphorobacter sp. HDW4B]|uniref:hypothetical protein n=1 Tax=Diaphorobacter sp. HDW4B TaxID=2714925 RepID=UPI00140BC307|nr:hypothetical protein [Diaphorobacter sp. HDW4B]QIL71836.1 hypothetical protein G7048_16605 [Diaphorobacter sp. HDW4B]